MGQQLGNNGKSIRKGFPVPLDKSLRRTFNALHCLRDLANIFMLEGHKEKHVGSVESMCFAHHHCQMKFKSFKRIDFKNKKKRRALQLSEASWMSAFFTPLSSCQATDPVL
jgi:hypothetical protein